MGKGAEGREGNQNDECSVARGPANYDRGESFVVRSTLRSNSLRCKADLPPQAPTRTE